jgi:hypothetical protein
MSKAGEIQLTVVDNKMMNRQKSITLILIFIFSLPGYSPPLYERASDDRLHVLFIGNSLTYTNDLPAIVEALARANQKRFIYQSITYPNLSLEDHWNRGEARKMIESDKWDVVVLQQGPSSLDESRQLLIDYTRRFDKVIRATKAKTALYMVWPAESRSKDFDRVIESYRLAAEDVHGLLLPVGAAWREGWMRDPKLALYSEDRFHPSVAGSYLAALVIYEKLFNQPPATLPAVLKTRSRVLDKIELANGQTTLLQEAAIEANKKY